MKILSSLILLCVTGMAIPDSISVDDDDGRGAYEMALNKE